MAKKEIFQFNTDVDLKLGSGWGTNQTETGTYFKYDKMTVFLEGKTELHRSRNRASTFFTDVIRGHKF